MGLFAVAIPAVIAYNRYAHDVDRAGQPLRDLHMKAQHPPAAILQPAPGIDHVTPSLHSRLKAEINIVPYIDVMLVLLVIFMVTAPLLNQGKRGDSPEGAGRYPGYRKA